MRAADHERSARWLSLIIRRPASCLLRHFLSSCVLIRLCKVATPWVRVDLRVAASGYSYSGIAIALSENAHDALERTRQCRRATVFQCFVASPDHESAVPGNSQLQRWLRWALSEE
jgi:hypothetical protein